MVRAKFKVTGIEEHYPGSRNITLSTQYDKNIPEDVAFNKATPSGKITMLVDNPAAIEQLSLGQSLYVDFTVAGPDKP